MGRLSAPLGPHTVHLCIDLQNLFGPDGPWVTPWMERILPLSAEIAAHAPQRTIFTRFIPLQNSTRPEAPGGHITRNGNASLASG